MGKKKKGKHRDDHASDHGHGGFGAVAGIAAMALEQVKTQLDSPAGRQMMATALRAAADALAPRPARAAEAPPRPAPPPVPPTPPEPPVAPSVYAGNPAEPPREPAPPPRPEVPPEVARVIGSVAAGLEKWAAKLGAPKE